MGGRHAAESIHITIPDIKPALLRAPALIPLLLMAPSILTYNTHTMYNAGNDVLGTGGELLFFGALAVSSLALLTRWRCFNPSLRKWYGVTFAVTVIIGTIIDATTGLGQLTAHLFLLTGFLMAMIAIPLLATSNRKSQKQLGKYWRPFQRYGTYMIWGLLVIHIILLAGFETQGTLFSVLHQRLYQIVAVSLLLIVLRVPAVQRWVKARQKAGQRVWLAVAPLTVIAVVGCVFLVNEELYTGVAAFVLNPVRLCLGQTLNLVVRWRQHAGTTGVMSRCVRHASKLSVVTRKIGTGVTGLLVSPARVVYARKN